MAEPSVNATDLRSAGWREVVDRIEDLAEVFTVMTDIPSTPAEEMAVDRAMSLLVQAQEWFSGCTPRRLVAMGTGWPRSAFVTSRERLVRQVARVRGEPGVEDQ